MSIRVYWTKRRLKQAKISSKRLVLVSVSIVSPLDHGVKYGEAMKELHYTRKKKSQNKSFNVATFLIF